MKEFRKGTTIITGASKGIGEACLRALAKDKERRIVAIARSKDKLKTLCENLDKERKQVFYETFDLSRIESIPHLKDKLVKIFPDINTLILNAGYSNNKLFVESTHKDRFGEMNLNYFAAAKLIEDFLPDFLERDLGHILAVGSLTSLVPFPGNAGYAASKAALYTLLRNLYIELRGSGVSVSMVLPGLTKTDLTQDLDTLLPKAKPETISRAVLRSLETKRFLEIPGFDNQIVYWFDRAFPRLTERALDILAPFLVPGYLQAVERSENPTKKES